MELGCCVLLKVPRLDEVTRPGFALGLLYLTGELLKVQLGINVHGNE